VQFVGLVTLLAGVAITALSVGVFYLPTLFAVVWLMVRDGPTPVPPGGRIDRKLKTPKTQGRDLNTYSEDVGGGTPLWGRYSARLFRPESELCQTITAERPAIKVPIMSGGLQELEHVYMKGPFFESRSLAQPCGNLSRLC